MYCIVFVEMKLLNEIKFIPMAVMFVVVSGESMVGCRGNGVAGLVLW